MHSRDSLILRWAWILPLLSATFYTVSNACMRQLAGLGADTYLAIAIRESVAFYFAAPLFLWMMFTGRTKRPTLKVFLTFLAVALAVQMVGNVLFQQALGVIGMAVTVAGNWTGVLLSTPVVGYLMLRERVSPKIFVSIFVIFTALFFLTQGTRRQEQENVRVSVSAHAAQASANTLTQASAEHDLSRHDLSRHDLSRHDLASARDATAAAEARFSEKLHRVGIQMLFLTVLVGVINAILCGYVRCIETGGYSSLFVVTMLPGTGFIALSLYDFSHNGLATYAAFTAWEYFWAYAAGAANLLAFVCLTFALKYLDVVKVNILNIFQIALAPVVGFFIFRENMNSLILTGIFLTILGIFIANIRWTRLRTTVSGSPAAPQNEV